MSDDSLARTPSAAPARAAADYDAIHETIVATERGRWFLDEHARRYRGADTERVLAAIVRIEQALCGGSAAEPAGSLPDELAAIAQTIAEARSGIIGRYGDPAASGEAAIADFRHAAGQIQELILAAHGRDTELGAQLSFQTNRLASAGERFERCIAGLRALLGVIEGIDQRLREGCRGSGTEAADAPPHSAAAVETESPVTWTLPAADAAQETGQETQQETQQEPEFQEDSLSMPKTAPIAVEAEQSAPQPDFGTAAAFWELTAAQPEADRDQGEPPEPSSGPETEASIADWAFTPADAGSAAADDRSLSSLDAPDVPEPPPADRAPMDEATSALEQLEAREYGRQRVATTIAAPAPGQEEEEEECSAARELPEPPQRGGWDDFVLGPSAMDEDGAGAPAPEASSLSWTIEPAAADHEAAAADWADAQTMAADSAGPLLDSDLFEGKDSEHAVIANPDMPASVANAGMDATQAALDETSVEDSSPEGMRAQDLDLLEEHTSDSWRPHSPAFLDPFAAEPVSDEARATGPDAEASEDRQNAWETRLPPLPAWPDPAPATASSEISAPDTGADVQTVLQRLETVRTAIAALMDEVNEKTARRNPPQS